MILLLALALSFYLSLRLWCKRVEPVDILQRNLTHPILVFISQPLIPHLLLPALHPNQFLIYLLGAQRRHKCDLIAPASLTSLIAFITVAVILLLLHLAWLLLVSL